MYTKDILWKVWSDSKLSIPDIQNILNEENKQELELWFRNAFKKANHTLIDLDMDKLIELASWSQYGTDSIVYHPKDMREKIIINKAKSYDLPIDVVRQLIIYQPCKNGY